LTIVEFVAQLDSDRTRLLQAIAGLPPEEMSAIPAVGEWSVREVLAHIAAWEWGAAEAIRQALSGQRPDLLDMTDFDAVNAVQVAARSERTLDEILDELHDSRRALVEALGQLNETQFESATAFPHVGRSLRQLLDWHHDREHAVQLEQWRERRGIPTLPSAVGLRLGAHMSIAGGVSKALERGHSIGWQAIQIFTRNQRQWRSKPLAAQEIERFHTKQAQTGIRPVVAHDSYLINLGSPDDALWEKSLRAYIVELRRCQALGIPYLVMHPGSHVGSGEEAGLRRVASALDRAHDATPDATVMTLLETTAGQGTNLGHRFEHLAAIREAVQNPDRVGVCFDTCHAFAAGYDLRTPETYAATMAEFDRILGLETLRCLHLNDCKRELGSNVDRHEHIGQGALGLEAFRLLMNDPRLAGLPGLLETPKGPEMLEDVENLRVLRSLLGRQEGDGYDAEAKTAAAR
jgi:deoxyribonuclease-4